MSGAVAWLISKTAFHEQWDWLDCPRTSEQWRGGAGPRPARGSQPRSAEARCASNFHIEVPRTTGLARLS